MMATFEEFVIHQLGLQTIALTTAVIADFVASIVFAFLSFAEQQMLKRLVAAFESFADEVLAVESTAKYQLMELSFLQCSLMEFHLIVDLLFGQKDVIMHLLMMNYLSQLVI